MKGSSALDAALSCISISGINAALTCVPEAAGSKNIIISEGYPTTQIAAGNTVEFSVTGVINPTTSSTSSAEIITMTSADKYIDNVATGLVPQLTCNSPCNTCQTTNKDFCFSCFTDASSTKPYLEANTCVVECASGSSYNNANTCVACASTCKTCSQLNKFECTTCDPAGAYPNEHATGK